MSLARDVTTVGGATLLSRLLGFLRDVVIAAVLGAGALADAFFVAVQIPNLFRRLLAEGALNPAAFGAALASPQRRERRARRAPLQRRTCLGRRSAPRSLRHRAGYCAAVVLALRRWCCCWRSGFCGRIPYLYAVYFLLGFRHALSRDPSVSSPLWQATLNAAGRVGAAAYGPVVFNVGDDHRGRGGMARSAEFGNSPVVGAAARGRGPWSQEFSGCWWSPVRCSASPILPSRRSSARRRTCAASSG